MAMVQRDWIYDMNTAAFSTFTQPWFDALEVGFANAGNSSIQGAWKSFKADFIKTTVSTGRRIQSVTTPSAAALNSDASGVNLGTSQKKTGLEVPKKLEAAKDQTAMALSNLAKVFSILASFAFLMMN
jgi:hypothetical protein